MRDIRALAKALAQHGADPHLEILAHAVIRAYAVDLLLNLTQAIHPTTPDEAAAVTWLVGEIHKIAALIPEAPKETKPS